VLVGKALYFGGNEMMLKTTLLLCDPIVTINTLVSCITGLEERFRPSIISTATNVVFSTNTKLCYRANLLSMKLVDALGLRSAWVRIVVDLPPLIMMGKKNKVLVLKTR
jgi:hypothetical protein